jgi:CheY-like chemotaxis protein
VISARNGREGLRALQQGNAPCIILLDWMMPVMNGPEFLEAIERDPQYADIPILVVTAFAGKDNTIPARHLQKPVSTEDLLREVRACCASA